MILAKFAEKQDPKKKALVIGKNVLAEIKAWKIDGMNLLGIDTVLNGKLVDFKKVTTRIKESGDNIVNIGLEFKDRIVLIPTSKNFDHSVFDNDEWFKSTLRIRNTKNELIDKEGEYTGPEGVSFGMPGELDVVENISLSEAVEVK